MPAHRPTLGNWIVAGALARHQLLELLQRSAAGELDPHSDGTFVLASSLRTSIDGVVLAQQARPGRSSCPFQRAGAPDPAIFTSVSGPSCQLL